MSLICNTSLTNRSVWNIKTRFLTSCHLTDSSKGNYSIINITSLFFSLPSLALRHFNNRTTYNHNNRITYNHLAIRVTTSFTSRR